MRKKLTQAEHIAHGACMLRMLNKSISVDFSVYLKFSESLDITVRGHRINCCFFIDFLCNRIYFLSLY